MLNQLDRLDITILIFLIILIPTAGITASLRKKSAENYFMAGRSLRWWTVAGSIFGTNISVSHLIGMLGIGFSIGFAQSSYELLSIPAMLLLAYVFIPAYRKIKIFTLSQFLGHRYNESAMVVYTFLMLILILVQMIAAFYIGSRTLMLLFNGTAFQIGYLQGIGIIAAITCLLTVFGGMESVVVTDNLQSIMMFFAGVIVAVATFMQPEIHGIAGLLHLDRAAPLADQKMHLYLPSNHPDLPWSGVFTGLITLNLFYWTTNQYVVQRALAAQTDREAKLGIMASGFLKLCIPFMSIATGVAAAYIFKHRMGANLKILPDDAFMHLIETVVPSGFGLKGFILAGLTAATFSSVDSMMNSATTLLTMDVYKKYLNKTASDKQLVRFGRGSVFVMIFLTAGFALLTYDPASAGNFFLSVSSRGAYFTPGIVVVFFLGIIWKKSAPKAAVITMISAPFISLFFELGYNQFLAPIPAVAAMFGTKLNFLHRVWFTFWGCALLQTVISLYFNKRGGAPSHQHSADTPVFAIDAKIAWTEIAIFSLAVLFSAIAVHLDIVPATAICWFVGIITFSIFIYNYKKTTTEWSVGNLLTSDRFYAGLLSGLTVWILFYFV